MVIMASGIARGRVRMTTTTTTELRNMAAILQTIGYQRQPWFAVYFFDIGRPTTINYNKLQYVQNFAARIIHNVRKYDHISSTLRNLRWLPVKTNVYYRDAILTFKCMAGQAPEYLTSR